MNIILALRQVGELVEPQRPVEPIGKTKGAISSGF